MDAILGFLNDPMVLGFIGILCGLLIKYNPRFANIPNSAIPYLNTLLAILAKMVAPADAHAANAIVIPGVAISTILIPGFIGTIVSAGWQAMLNSLVYEVFLRHPIKAVGIEKQ